MLQIPAQTLAAIVAQPQALLSAYAASGGISNAAYNAPGGSNADTYVRSALGAQFASLLEVGCLATFASAVAFKAAPAGSTTLEPLTATLHQLLTAEALEASHFCKLNALLALLGSPGLIPPDAALGSPAKPTLHFLVWVGTVPLNTGPHMQLLITNVLANAYLLLDPTYAYALRVPFTGSGPQARYTVAENAAIMLQTPTARDDLAVLDPAGTQAVPHMLQVVISGALGPQYLNAEPDSGYAFWDEHIGQIIDNLS